MDENKIESICDEDAAWLDQFLYRFTKLQDAMGDRVFIDGMLLLDEDFREKPFLDAVNRLEGLGMIPGRQWWQELRELRNQIAHEYPDRRNEQAAAVNAIFEKSSELAQVFDEFVRTVEEKVGGAST